MIVPIIPAYNPDQKLELIIKELEKYYHHIIIVDDGSASKDIFKKIKKDNNCILLTHEVNKGKGEALKTAYTYYQDHLIKDYAGVISLDADGQHLVSDVCEMDKALKDNFMLGTRLFNTKEVPFRNKLGNRITSRVFKWLYKVYLKDTQTGLRAVPNRLISFMLNVPGSRFEYEMNCLTALVKNKEKIDEFDIQTVYLQDSNKKSHFKVLDDSYQIYKNMINGRKK